MARDGAEREWLGQLRTGDPRAFERLFRAYAAPLCDFALSFVRVRETAEEIVQDGVAMTGVEVTDSTLTRVYHVALSAFHEQLVPGGTYHLRVLLKTGEDVTGTTTIPAARPSLPPTISTIAPTATSSRERQCRGT